jgi:hypothetical protein
MEDGSGKMGIERCWNNMALGAGSGNNPYFLLAWVGYGLSRVRQIRSYRLFATTTVKPGI